jgi:hypothetical protein
MESPPAGVKGSVTESDQAQGRPWQGPMTTRCTVTVWPLALSALSALAWSSVVGDPSFNGQSDGISRGLDEKSLQLGGFSHWRDPPRGAKHTS